MLFKENTRERDERQKILEGAVSDWNDAETRLPAQRLSAGARANVRALARQSAQVASERPLARLFLPATRLAAAAAVPALILAVSFGWLLGSDPQEGRLQLFERIRSRQQRGHKPAVGACHGTSSHRGQ